jgi:hypothetical protein
MIMKKVATKGLRRLLFLTFLMPLLTLQAQESGRFEVGADLMSRYVWRGSDFANSPSIQPFAYYAIGGFKAEVWSAFSTTQNYQEVDLILSYQIQETFTIMFTDYFFPNGTNFNNRYFEFGENKTGHIMEATVAFEGTPTLPLSASINYNFYGADPDKSWYFELGYSGRHQEVNWDVFIGATPGKGIYMPDGSDEFNVVNLGATLSKEVKITEHFSLPLSGSLVINPQADNIFFVFGVSL